LIPTASPLDWFERLHQRRERFTKTLTSGMGQNPPTTRR